MFLDNKYTRWYNTIISKAKSRSASLCVVEIHHIIPDCFYENRSRGKLPGWLPGDPNSLSNLVELTPREHFICHWLLTKMVDDIAYYKMEFALSSMRRASSKQSRILSAGQYERSKLAALIANKKYIWWNNGKDQCKSIKCPGQGWVKGTINKPNLGKIWWNNGTQRRVSKECPGPGWVIGYTLEQKFWWHYEDNLQYSAECTGPNWKKGNPKFKSGTIGKKWWNKDGKRLLSENCPGEGWIRGTGVRPGKDKPWWNNGKLRKQSFECPGKDWVRGKGKTKI